MRIAVGESQEFLHFLHCRRHDRQTVGPAILQEEPVHFLERPFEKDLPGIRLLKRLRLRWLLGQIADNIIDGDIQNIGAQLVIGLDIHMSWHLRKRQVRHTKTRRRCAGLSNEPFTNERGTGNPCFFGGRACPQHGGRAAASTAHT